MTPSAEIVTASPADEPGIRALLREADMDGDIRVAFTREPDYFAAQGIDGDPVDTIVARCKSSHEVVGLGSRAERRVYVNGSPARVGYLSGLRIHSAHRGTAVLINGYRKLKRLHDLGSVPFYLSTIVDGNETALRLLTSNRAGLPTYRDFGAYCTFLYGIGPIPARQPDPKVQIRAAAPQDLPLLFRFLKEVGATRQFFPCYRPADLEDGLLKGIRPADILLAFRSDSLVGCIALWEQTSFRQRIVTGYSPRLSRLRPFWNGFARATNRPVLPPSGQAAHMLCLALFCVAGDDPKIARALLHAALRKARQHEPRPHAVLLGLHERDPLLPVAASFPHRCYGSRLYLVHWADGTDAVAALDDRPPYLEVGGL